MSEENVETVRRAWSALDRGDLGAAFADAAPDVGFEQTRALGIDRGLYTLDEFKRLTRSFINTWRPSAARPTS
jgi:ketosteroid isomerase-like protein